MEVEQQLALFSHGRRTHLAHRLRTPLKQR